MGHRLLSRIDTNSYVKTEVPPSWLASYLSRVRRSEAFAEDAGFNRDVAGSIQHEYSISNVRHTASRLHLLLQCVCTNNLLIIESFSSNSSVSLVIGSASGQVEVWNLAV